MIKKFNDFTEDQRLLIDSEASASLTGKKELLESYKGTKTIYFATAGKEQLAVEGWGLLNFPTSFGNVKIKCGYSPMLAPTLTLIGVGDLMNQDTKVQFGKRPEDTFLERNGRRHHLKKHNDCLILSTVGENVESFTSRETIGTHAKWMNWHRRLGHASPTKMKQTLGDVIKLPKDLMVCTNCSEANSLVQSFVIHNATIEEAGTKSFKLEADVMYMDYKVLSQGFILHILYDSWLELFYVVEKREARAKIFEHLANAKQKPR